MDKSCGIVWYAIHGTERAAVGTLRAVSRGHASSLTLLTSACTDCAAAIAHHTCVREP